MIEAPDTTILLQPLQAMDMRNKPTKIYEAVDEYGVTFLLRQYEKKYTCVVMSRTLFDNLVRRAGFTAVEPTTGSYDFSREGGRV